MRSDLGRPAAVAADQAIGRDLGPGSEATRAEAPRRRSYLVVDEDVPNRDLMFDGDTLHVKHPCVLRHHQRVLALHCQLTSMYILCVNSTLCQDLVAVSSS